MSGIKSHFKGTVTHDPELKYTNNSGIAYCRLPMACNWREQGEQQTQYVDATAWGRTAEFCATYVRRGARLAVDLDRMYIREYQRQDGSMGYSLSANVVEVDLIDWPDDDQGQTKPADNGDTGGFNDVNFDDPGAGPDDDGHDQAAADGVPFDDPFNDDPPF